MYEFHGHVKASVEINEITRELTPELSELIKSVNSNKETVAEGKTLESERMKLVDQTNKLLTTLSPKEHEAQKKLSRKIIDLNIDIANISNAGNSRWPVSVQLRSTSDSISVQGGKQALDQSKLCELALKEAEKQYYEQFPQFLSLDKQWEVLQEAIDQNKKKRGDEEGLITKHTKEICKLEDKIIKLQKIDPVVYPQNEELNRRLAADRITLGAKNAISTNLDALSTAITQLKTPAAQRDRKGMAWEITDDILEEEIEKEINNLKATLQKDPQSHRLLDYREWKYGSFTTVEGVNAAKNDLIANGEQLTQEVNRQEEQIEARQGVRIAGNSINQLLDLPGQAV